MLQAVETAQRTDTGRQRRGNEDSLFARPPVFVIADGMGGAQAGEVASRIAVETFAQAGPSAGPREEHLASIVQDANREIFAQSHQGEERAGMGTTLTAALIESDHVAIAHVGDSRAYMYRDGELVRLTRDHSLVDELVQRGKLTEEEALEHPQRSIITRALGPEPDVEVDTWSYPVRDGDVILLCTDGLTSMIGESQIAAILASGAGLASVADQMIDAANAAGGRDNITVILVRVGESETGHVEGLEQETMITHTVAPPASAIEPAVVAAPPPVIGSGRSDPAPRALPHPPAWARSRVPLARTQGHAKPERQLTRPVKFVIAILSVASVLFLVGGAGYLASRQLYFLGTNAQGMVTVYRGFPYVAPFGVPLYETFYVSGLPASLIPADRRGTLLNHNLETQTAATKLINQLELGQVSG